MPGASHRVREEIYGVLAFIGAIWVVFAADWIVPGDLNNSLGLAPRTLHGLVGIVSMPFLHDGIGHLAGNTVPLFVLLTLLAGSRARSWTIVVEIVLLGGGLLWVFGRGGTVHVGASGLVFGLAAFLIASGLLERRPVALGVAVLVAFLYGGSLLAGVLPAAGDVSWDGHLCGAIAGVASAYGLARDRGPRAAA